jgi:hypothetical protein
VPGNLCYHVSLAALGGPKSTFPTTPTMMVLVSQREWTELNGDLMTKLIGLILVLALAGCSVCKSSDSPEVCRTKERDHSQPRTEFAAAIFGIGR